MSVEIHQVLYSRGVGGSDIRIIQVEGEFEEMDNLRTKNTQHVGSDF